MNFVSTRGDHDKKGFSDVLLSGLAPDGGLYVPEVLPNIPRDLQWSWKERSYQELAIDVLSYFVTDIPAAALRQIVHKAYSRDLFPSDDVTPVSQLEPGLHLLHLSGGPTLAFKDVAMQLMGGLFEYVLQARREFVTIVGATSGDTGPAAEHALRGKHGIHVYMLSPHGRMSAFQRAQMFSLQDENIHNLAVEGTFDDCQDIVKALNADKTFKQAHRISAVNSINLGRVLAQVVYYFFAYLRVAKSAGEEVDFVVPSGNFGNVYAGHLARQIGLPIGRLIVATNENDTLHRFFSTGHYAVSVPSQTRETSSPSMDVSKPSNLERFIFDLVDRDPREVARLWSELEATGAFDVSSKPDVFARMERQFGFQSGTSSHSDRLEMIRMAQRRWNVVIDPHTADGLKVGLAARRPGVPLVAMETALPAKFEAIVGEALKQIPPRRPEHRGIEELPQRFNVVAASTEAVKKAIQFDVAAASERSGDRLGSESLA